jgi:hypothetical protein
MEEESGNKPFSKPNFGELMSERGFEKGHQGNKGGWFWQGIRLRKEGEEQQAKPEPIGHKQEETTTSHEQVAPVATEKSNPIAFTDAKKLPHCQSTFCLIGPNRTQWKLNGFWCPSHNGWIDENGRAS